MNIFIILLFRKILSSRISKEGNKIGFTKDEVKQRPVDRSSTSDNNIKRYLHIIVPNKNQNLIDDTSLAIPFVKKFLEAHLKKIISLIEECIEESIERQKIQRVNDGNLINEKTIYKSICSIYSEILREKYINFCSEQKCLNNKEI
ncbi:hypothetical protein CWI39_0310p0020 [Hamiltosporidium magnivora]|uniref:Uncharacterized protein n=1 Tax=Hamiltosporidium magnivora TaxID=148818 RepID=A0A4Q9LHA3_9MICR|nr:hypothetical protein CWI39_0310p0020 [Hamiltosporidium magnivora]